MCKEALLLIKRIFSTSAPSKVRECAVSPDHLRSEIYLAHLQHSEKLQKHENKKLIELNV